MATTVGIWVSTTEIRHIVRDFIINIKYSDVIPALKIFVTRWLVGAEVYTPLTWEMGYLDLPTYLPATWFPFVIAEQTGLDYRILAWSIFVLGCGSYAMVLWRRQLAWLPTLVLALVPFLSIYLMQLTDPSSFGLTVETLIIGYYSLLISGILLRSWSLVLIGLLACLLSRYSLVFWVPLLLGMMFFQDSRRRVLLLAGALLIGVLLLYIVPFLSHDWTMPGQVQAYYTMAAVGEWVHLNENGLPLHLYNGVGMAPFFYKYASGSTLEKMMLLKAVHVILLLAIVTGAGLLYWRQRSPRMNYQLYAVVVLKLYLATFYAFVQVPYTYLAMVGVFTSVFMVLMLSATSVRAAVLVEPDQ
ncbi:hypothetical protein IC235_03180 [Hymenobacter sp. BT664]|uniref:Uncharacterized protein n=1 Tax=Hymenobacter montanus TaxID=2771359 RepID=A0A927BB54_9BACT|nr:hypothetical protein [Hymenobacter montanus]MBD2766893.1 hypothetical protein [Hymenobacter montanus]